VGRGLVTVNAGLTGPAYRLSDEHHAGLVVLVLRSLESDPVNARYRPAACYRTTSRYGATTWYGATSRYGAAPASKKRHQKPYLCHRYKLPHDIKLRADENSYYLVLSVGIQTRSPVPDSRGVPCDLSLLKAGQNQNLHPLSESQIASR
jgi:hypothetical protein